MSDFTEKSRKTKNESGKPNYPTKRLGRATTGVRFINERKLIGNVVCVNSISESKRGKIRDDLSTNRILS